MKKLLVAIVIAALAVSVPACRKLNPIIPKDVSCVPCAVGNVYEFKDAAVEAAVRTALGKTGNTCDVCVTDLLNIQSFYVNSQITNYEDFELMPNIQELTLSNMTVPSFSFTADLPLLHKLSVFGSAITSLSGISGAAALTELAMANCSITNVAPLATLANMLKLNLTGNHISSISALSGMTKLTELKVGSNRLASLEGVESMTDLITLEANNNTITTISAISGLTNLQTIKLNENRIVDIGPLTGMTLLTNLEIGYNQAVNISVLQGLVSLKFLDITGNGIIDITPLINNPGIAGYGDEVRISGNSIDPCDVETLMIRGVYMNCTDCGICIP